MHELSLCHSIHRIVERAAEGRPVTTIHLQVGHLRQVVPATLEYCWGLVSESTPLAGSTLDIDHIPAQVSCQQCGHVNHVTDRMLLCPDCHSADVAIVSGEEFLLTSLELSEV